VKSFCLSYLTAAGNRDIQKHPHTQLTECGSFDMLILLFMARKTFLIPLPAEHFISEFRVRSL